MRPDLPEAHNNLGAALSRLGMYRQAFEHFAEAVRLNPNYAKAHNNLGLELMRQGKIDEAIGHFQEALRLGPDMAEAAENLRRAQAQRGVPQGGGTAVQSAPSGG